MPMTEGRMGIEGAHGASTPKDDPSTATPRYRALERLLDARQQTTSLTEGQWAALTAHIVDGALSSDDATLERAFTNLQWMAAQLDRLDGDQDCPDSDRLFERG